MKPLAACAGDSKLARLSCICVVYCIGCIERWYATSRNAYVLTMLNGTPLYLREALSLLTKHALGQSCTSIGSAFLLLGKIFVLAACAAVGAIACSPALTLAPIHSVSLSLSPYPASPAPSPSPRSVPHPHPRTSGRAGAFSIVPALVVIAIGSWLSQRLRGLRRRGRLHADELPASCTHGRFAPDAFMGIYNVVVDSILSFAVDLGVPGTARQHTTRRRSSSSSRRPTTQCREQLASTHGRPDRGYGPAAPSVADSRWPKSPIRPSLTGAAWRPQRRRGVVESTSKHGAR